MDTKPAKNCPSCGTLLDQGADSLADGLCPRCLLASSLHSTIAGHPGSSSVPTVDEVAAAFPDLEIIELIGRGGMGAVYKARQRSLDRLVALKLLPQSLSADPEFAKRFEAEAKALGTLNHPNIVTVHEFGHRDDFYFLLMEYVDGPNLRSLLVDHRMSPEEALTIVPPLCEALEFAHQRNIVHCDIKPENLLLNTEGKVKIADFGIARILGQGSADLESEKVAGTPAYMAPEQMDSPHAIDTRADIYSLGVVIYEMLTGERPSADLTPPSGKNSSLDIRLDEIVLRALEANPKSRWQSANALNTELQTILTDALGEPKVTPPENLPNSTPKRAWFACTLAVAAVVIFASGFFASKHVTPVSESEHQAAIGRWFDFKLERSNLDRELRALDRRLYVDKESLTPAELERKEEIWDQLADNHGLDIFGTLRGVKEPLLSDPGYRLVVCLSVILGLVAVFLGRRHLSWLRGQEEPLPALVAGLVGTLLCPLLFTAGLILTSVFRYESVLVNTLGLTGALLLSLWTVRRVLAWTRNLRHAPSFSIMLAIATVLIGLAMAAPFTSAQKRYRSAVQQLASETVAVERSHQEYFSTMHRNQNLSEAEKLEAAKLGCEDYASKTQRLQLLLARPLKLQVPEGGDLIKSGVWSLLALAAAFILLRKFRSRRA